MHRSGFRWDDDQTLAALSNLLGRTEGWEGVFTHFHSSPTNPSATAEQWSRLQRAIERLGRRPPFVHAANSAGCAHGSAYCGDLVRPGIHLFGGRVPGLDTIPVARVMARVSAVRRVRAGESVSYDATWTAPNATTIATLSIGYGDGISRSLSNAGAVELLGVRVRMVGRVTMDQLMVDAGELPVAPGDVATVIGGLVSLDEQAALAGTISYELLTSLGARLPRIHQGKE